MLKKNLHMYKLLFALLISLMITLNIFIGDIHTMGELVNQFSLYYIADPEEPQYLGLWTDTRIELNTQVHWELIKNYYI